MALIVTACRGPSSSAAPSPSASSAPLPAAEIPPQPPEGNWVRVAPGNRYLGFEDGKPFVPLGVALPGHSISLDYFGTVTIGGKQFQFAEDTMEQLLRDMQQSGENLLRIDIEGTSLMPRATIEGLIAEKKLQFLEQPAGHFNEAYAKRIDRLITLAEKYDVYLCLALFTHSCDVTALAPNLDLHPYHRRLGGPLAHINDLFVDERARAMFKRRLTYISDRWGHSRRIAMWELYNELLNCGGNDAKAAAAWVSEMGGHLRNHEQDRYGKAHPIVVSSDDIVPESDFFVDSPGTDVMVTHYYRPAGGSGNPAALAVDLHASVVENLKRVEYKRPFLENERTLSWRFPTAVQREMEHVAAWTYLTSGAAGAGATWLNIGAWQPFRDHSVVGPTHLSMRSILERIDFEQFRGRPAEVTSKNHEVLAFVVADRSAALGFVLHNNSVDYRIDNIRSWLAGEIRDPRIAPLMMHDLLEVLATQGVKAPIAEYKKELVRMVLKHSRKSEPAARKLVDELFADPIGARERLGRVPVPKRRAIAKELARSVNGFRLELARSPEVRVALAKAYRKHPKVKTELAIGNLADAPLVVTWYDAATGAELSRGSVAGPTRILTPSFAKHVVFTAQKKTD